MSAASRPATASEPARSGPRWSPLRLREATLLVLIVALGAVMTLASPYFLTMANFRAIAVGLVPTAIIAVGMTYLLVSGSFDLSVGSVMALCSTVVAMLLVAGWPIGAAVVGALLLGACVGLLNGLVVAVLGVNAFVATLGTMSVARGVALVATEGFSVSNLPPAFGALGKTEWAGWPQSVWIMLATVVLGDLALRHVAVLRQLYFLGANERASRLSGIDVRAVRILSFVISGTLAALAGVLLASRLMSGTPTAGAALELQVLAACVIGGASLRGGEGTVAGAVLGALFVALINNAMTMLAVSIYWQTIVTGTVLVAAVAIDTAFKKHST